MNVDEEFVQFLDKVEEIGSIIKSLGSEEVENASRKADEYLLNIYSKAPSKITNEDGLCIKINKTSINKSPSKPNLDPVDTKPQDISKATLLTFISQDAERRFADKKSHKAKSEFLKKEANISYRSEDYLKALDLYNKAIDEVCDSCVLYTNRALTLLQLGLYNKALEDCKAALRLSPTSLKALVYKARAHKALGEMDLADACVQEAFNHHPQHRDCIIHAVSKHNLSKN